MIDLLERLTDDTLWIYTAILGSLLGAAFLFWFKDTRMAQWGVAKFDSFLEMLAIRWGWTWLQTDPDLWRKKYPKITMKIDQIESDFNVLSLRLKTLEAKAPKTLKQKKETKK
jgi:hypothetical protein|tara:strand:- start:847 stop:1185 length:339 start_codon:yes stop_codon:yes gene_type:complete